LKPKSGSSKVITETGYLMYFMIKKLGETFEHDELNQTGAYLLLEYAKEQKNSKKT